MAKFALKKDTAKRIAANIFYPLLALAIALAVWAIWSAAMDIPGLVPMPGEVIRDFFTLGAQKAFWLDVLSSLGRTALCFVISFALALLFASLGGLFKPLHRVVSPLVSVLRAAPTVAVILIIYAFMEKRSMTLVVGFLIAFPILYSSFYSAIEGVDKGLIEMANIYKVRTADKIFMIYLTSIAPQIFDTSRSTLSLTLKVVVAAEIITNLAGSIGHDIQIAYATPNIVSLFSWTLIAIVFSFVLEGIVSIFKKLWEAAACR